MRSLIVLIVTLAVFSCKNQETKQLETKPIDSTTLQVAESYTDGSKEKEMDKEIIVPEPGDTLEFTKQELSALKNCILGVDDGSISSPDDLYAKNELFVYTGSDGKQQTMSFSCEACRDAFYETYAYFLKSRNGIEKYDDLRNRVIDIFRSINEISGVLEHGGTYFGHQDRRILGYAEYAVYKYHENDNYSVKNDQLTKDKRPYIDSLRLLIATKIEGDGELTRDDKVEIKERLLGKVSMLDKLINDYFLLENAREFQHTHYRNM